MSVAALVLAAGEGRRFGGPKALVAIDGELLVDRAVRVLAESGCTPVVVVLGAAAGDVVAHASLTGAVVVVNDAWPEGIGSSLRCGLTAVADLGASHVVVLLADQPLVTPETVARVVAHRDDAPAVVASYGGRPRNPVLLAASVWDAVRASARGDVGARAWMRAHPGEVALVACDDLGSDADIDTPEDLAALRTDETAEGDHPA